MLLRRRANKDTDTSNKKAEGKGKSTKCYRDEGLTRTQIQATRRPKVSQSSATETKS
jgi:hypothetical protein